MESRLWVLLSICSLGPGWTGQAEEDEDQTKVEMEMAKIMERMRMIEAEMETKDRRIAALEDAMTAKELQVSELQQEMKGLVGRINVTEETDVQLMEMMDQVRNPPFAFQCAWQSGLVTAENSVITFERLSYSSMFGVTGGLDISTGVFTAGYNGVWTLSYATHSEQGGGDVNSVYLYLNETKVEESVHYTYNSGGSEHFQTLGSRTLHLRLEVGDVVTLRTGRLQDIGGITLCFELAQFDWTP